MRATRYLWWMTAPLTFDYQKAIYCTRLSLLPRPLSCCRRHPSRPSLDGSYDLFSNALLAFLSLTRALLGGGGRLNAPLRFFEDSEKTAARSAAGFSPTLPPIFSATFVKISTQCHVRSGHQVRSNDPTTK